MNAKQRIAISVLMVFGVVAMDLRSQQNNMQRQISLSTADVHYIYNRAFDIALRDHRAELIGHSVFKSTKFVNFDSILITVDPILTSNAYDAKYIQPLREKDYDDTLGVQEVFNKVLIINTGNIVYKHYEHIPALTGNHLLHVEFSDLYAAGSSLYVGVSLTYQMRTNKGFDNWPEWVLFELEWCHDRYVMFRRFFIPIGVFDADTHTYTSSELFDRACQ